MLTTSEFRIMNILSKSLILNPLEPVYLHKNPWLKPGQARYKSDVLLQTNGFVGYFPSHAVLHRLKINKILNFSSAGSMKAIFVSCNWKNI